MKTYQDLAAAKVEIRSRDVAGRTYLQPVLNGEFPSINLTPDTASCDVLYGLRTDGLFEKPSFLGGQETKGREGLSMTVVPGPELKEWLQKIDAACKEQFFETAKGAAKKAEWQPLVAAKGSLDSEAFKIKVVLGGARGLTALTVKKECGEVVRGSGFDFAKPLIEEYWGFKGARVKLAVKLHSVWSMSNKAGLTLHASFAAFQPTQPAVEKDPFEDCLVF